MTLSTSNLRSNTIRTRQRAGFTLVELLSAMAITSLLMLSLFSMVGQSSTNYRLSSRKVTTLSDTRSFFHFLQTDLSARVSDTKFFWQASAGSGHSIAFVRTSQSLTNTATGDLETSLYYVAFTSDDNRRGSPKIFRRSLDAAATQKLLESGNTAAFPSFDPAVDEPILYNVVRFEMEPQQRNAAGDWEPWLSTATTAPGQLQITLELTDDFSAQRLSNEADWSKVANATDLKQREAVKRFTHTISLTP